MAIARHRGDERGTALYRRMEIDFAEPLWQVLDQPEDPLLHHAAAPGEAEDIVVGAQTGPPHAAPQRFYPEAVEWGRIVLTRNGPAQHPDRFIRNAHRLEPKVLTDLDDQPGHGWMKV